MSFSTKDKTKIPTATQPCGLDARFRHLHPIGRYDRLGRIYQLSSSLGLAIALLIPQTALGHGFELVLEENQIVAEHSIFEAVFATIPNGFFAEDGSIEAGTGFSLPGDTFHFDVLTPLLYSAGGPAMGAPVGTALSISNEEGTIDRQLTGATPGVAGFALSGSQSDGEINWALAGDSIPDGVYGLAYRVSGQNAAGSPFSPSGPLVIAFRTPDFTGNTPASVAAIVARASIPEPTSIGLAVIGGLIACLARRRHRHASNRAMSTGTVR